MFFTSQEPFAKNLVSHLVSQVSYIAIRRQISAVKSLQSRQQLEIECSNTTLKEWDKSSILIAVWKYVC